MSTVVKELIARFSSDTKGLEDGATKAASVISNFGVNAAKAAGAVGVAFAALAVRQSIVADELGRIADKFGIATEAMTRLNHAASLADVSTMELANSFNFMLGSLFEAANGSETAIKAYKALGLNVATLINMRPEDAFNNIADAISKVENPAMRSALAIDIFGRNGANLIPLFKEGAEGLARASEEADRFGLSITKIDHSALDAANDAIHKVGDAVNGAARQFAVGLAPAISITIEKLLSGVDVAGRFREAGFNLSMIWATGVEGIARGVDALWVGLRKLEIGAMEAGKAMRTLMKQDTTELEAAINMKRVQLNRDETNLQLRGSFKGGDYNTSILKGIIDANKTYMDSPAFRGGKQNQDGVPKTLAQVSSQSNIAKESIKSLGSVTTETAKKMKDGFKETTKEVDIFADSALQSAQQIGGALGNLFGQKIGGGVLGGGLGGIFGNLLGKGLSSIIGGTFLGGAGFDLRSGIKWNADGGIVSGRSVFPSSQGMQGAGEAGPEAILPLARVNGKLGVKSAGGNSQTVQNIYIQTGVSQTVRAEMLRLLPQFRQEAFRSVTESQMRGQTP